MYVCVFVYCTHTHARTRAYVYMCISICATNFRQVNILYLPVMTGFVMLIADDMIRYEVICVVYDRLLSTLCTGGGKNTLHISSHAIQVDKYRVKK